VLDQARNPANPALERVKFLAIVSSNFDEFFEIRVAGVMQQADSESAGLSIDGLTPREQLRRIYREVTCWWKTNMPCWHKDLLPQLAQEGVLFRTATKLDESEDKWIRGYFETQVCPC